MKEYKCTFCGKDCEQYHNYCSWQCHIEEAKKEGGRVHTPNGLPIRCIRHDGLMLEHEHGDHPDYKYPVNIEYIGPIDDDLRHDFELLAGKPAESDEAVRVANGETHALIYTDGYVAVTMYECCYAMWSARTGKCLGGSLWHSKGGHRLDISSLRLPVNEPEEGSNEQDQ